MIDSIEINDRITKCERILEDNPQSQIFAALADAYRKKGDIQKAQEICSDGLKIHPDYPSARIVLAKILIAKGNHDQGWDELKKAVALSGRTRAVDILEAEIFIQKGQKSAASALIDSLSSVDPDDDNVKNLKEMLNKENSTSSVIKT
jgi:tetratricopeptide (TPR) repeat protein